VVFFEGGCISNQDPVEFSQGDEQMETHDGAAEKAVLGSLLHDPESVDIVTQSLTREDFYFSPHRLTFDALVGLGISDPASVTKITAANRLEPYTDQFPGKNPRTFLDMLPAGISQGLPYHVEIVHRLSVQRRLAGHCEEIIGRCFDDHKENLSQFLGEAEERIFSISHYAREAIYYDPAVLFQAVAESLEERYVRAHTPGATLLTGMPSGFPRLDEQSRGFQPGDLIIVAGRPSMGKTSFALTIADHVAGPAVITEDGGQYPVAIFSMEMSASQLGQRLLAHAAQIPYGVLDMGTYTDEQANNLHAAQISYRDRPIYIDDTPALTILDMRARARRMKREQDIQAIFVDYLQLMSGNKRTKENRVQEVTEISSGLKAMARELEVPVICLSQLNRQVEYRSDKRPLMSDLRESGSIEQDADMILFLYRDEIYNPTSPAKGFCEVIISKHRNGPTGMIPLKFIGETMRFLPHEGSMPSSEDDAHFGDGHAAS
jgi:replicative DNA helicase